MKPVSSDHPLSLSLRRFAAVCLGCGLLAAADALGAPLTPDQAGAAVERAYRDVLRRPPDPGGRRTFTERVVAEQRDDAWLRDALRQSAEGRAVARAVRRMTLKLAAVVGLPLLGVWVIFVRRRNVRDFVFKLVLVSLSVGATALLLEAGLRIKARVDGGRHAAAWTSLGSSRMPAPNSRVSLRQIIQPSANPRLVYELIPNLAVRFIDQRLTTTPDGCRTTPRASAASNAFCIVGLGDSVMFGWGVNDDEPYLACLARQLSEERPTRPVTIINQAVPGYNTVMEVESLKTKVLTRRPGLVLVHFVENDLGLPNFVCPAPPAARSGSHLWSALSERIGGRCPTTAYDELVPSPDDIPPRYAHLAGETAYRDAMRELGGLSRRHGFKVAVIVNWSAPPFVQEAAREAGMPILELGPTLTEYCKTHGIETYQGSVLTVSRRDPHFSAIGHDLIARRLRSFMDEHHLLDTGP